MENKLQLYVNEKFGEIRGLMIDGEPYFVGKDVAQALGYERDTKAVVDHVDEKDRKMIDGKTQSRFGIELGQRGGWLINESGLYSLILSSKLPAAKEFQRWVTSEVLPSIRKTGAYGNVPQSLTSLVNEVIGAATAIENYLNVTKEWAFIHAAEVASTHYGVDLTPFKQLDSADKNPGYMNATQAAEACHEKGGARQFNKVAEKKGYQYKGSDGKWHLTDKGKPFADIRFFEVKHVNGESHQGTQILWKETMIAEYERAVQDEKVCDNLFEGL